MPSDKTTSIAAVSWILELPRDLGLADDTYSSTGTAGDLPGGWEGHLDQLPEWPGCEFRGIPRRRLRFRRAYVGIGMPTEATDRTFGDLKRLHGFQRFRHAVGLRRLSRRGMKEWKTVCQMTKWYSGSEIDAELAEAGNRERTPLQRGFAELLADLDLWLQAYGLVAGRLDIGTISLHDFPPAVPWTIHIKESPHAPEVTLTGLLPVHDRVPAVLPSEGDQDAAGEAGFIVAAGASTIPPFTAFTLLFQAQAHALAGRGRQSAIDAGTAVEALVALVVRRSLSAQGESDIEISKTLKKQWPTIYNRDLLRALNVEIGKGGPAHSKWWRCHYRRRNAAVHDGAALSQADALEMVSDTWDLFDWVGEKARACPDLSTLGQSLKVMRQEASE